MKPAGRPRLEAAFAIYALAVGLLLIVAELWRRC